MQISSIVSGLTDTSTTGKKNENTAQTAAGVAKLLGIQTQNKTNSSKVFADILRDYDVTDITPDEYAQMVQKLYKAGVLSEKDYQELAAVRADLESSGIDSDESVNLVEYYTEKISDAQNNTDNTSTSSRLLAPNVRRLDWMQKFSTIHANPDSAGLDLSA